MKCTKCGREIPDKAKYCPQCGAKTEVGEQRSPKENEDQITLSNGTGEKKSRKKVAVVCIVLLCCLVVGGISYVWHHGNDSVADSDYYKAFTAEEVAYDKGESYVSSELLLTAADDVTDKEIEEIIKTQGGEIAGHIAVSNDYQIYFPDGKSYDELQSILNQWFEEEAIEAVMLNYVTTETFSSIDYSNDPWQAATPNKTLEKTETSEIWSISNPGGSNWWAEAIGMPVVWSLSLDWQTVKVGIYDSMFDTSNEDLADRFADNGLYQNPDDVSSIYQDLLDTKGGTDEEKAKIKEELKNAIHGTHVAGIIGAQTNGFGIAGVSQNAELYGFASAGEDEFEYVSVMEVKYGIAFLLSNGAKVINRSMNFMDLSVAAQYDESLGIAVEDSFALTELNQISESLSAFLSKCLENYDFLIIISAGNQNGYTWIPNTNPSAENPYSCVREKSTTESDQDSGIDIDWSSEYDVFAYISDANVRNHILTVGAISYEINEDNVIEQFVEADYSAKGADIYAPGTDILSDYPTNITEYDSGTSMAAPMVTGIAALIWGVNPDLSATEVREILLDSTEFNNWNEEMVNAPKAVILALTALNEENDNSSEETASCLVMGYAYKSWPDEAEDKEVITGATYQVYETGNEEMVAEFQSEDDGTFVGLLPEGEYTVEVTADGYNVAEYSLEIEAGNVSYIEVPMTLKATQVTWEEEISFNEETGSDWISNIITGRNNDGERCWVIEPDSYELVGDFESCFEIGANSDYFYYFEYPLLKCICIADGELTWEKEIPLSNVSGYAFDEKGFLYLGGVFSEPMFIAVDSDGNIVAELSFMDDTSYYPSDFIYDDGILSLTLRNWADYKTVYYVDVDTSDYSFEFHQFPSLGTSEECKEYREFLENGSYTDDISYLDNTGYALYDLDGDGISELILNGEYVRAMQGTIIDGEAVQGVIAPGSGEIYYDKDEFPATADYTPTPWVSEDYGKVFYYIYTYNGSKVTNIGYLTHTGENVLYYSGEKNLIAVGNLTSMQYYGYTFYTVDNKLQENITIIASLPQIENRRAEEYVYYIKESGETGDGTEITENEWDEYCDSLKEIEFSEFTVK